MIRRPGHLIATLLAACAATPALGADHLASMLAADAAALHGTAPASADVRQQGPGAQVQGGAAQVAEPVRDPVRGMVATTVATTATTALAPLSTWVPGGVQDRRDSHTRIRGVQLRGNLWLGSTQTNDGWEGGLVLRQGDSTMAFNHRGATFSYRF